MIELEAKAKQIYPILDGVPPMGQCARIFKPSTLEMLRTGKRNGKDILTEVLETPTLKDEFLNEIGFVKVSSFLEARTFGKQPGINQADAIDLIKKAAFEEYTKNAERLAFEQPDGQSYVRLGGDWNFLNAQNDIRRLTTYGLDTIFPQPRAELGRQLSNKTRAQQLRAEANLHPFVPGVFLESNRVPPGPAAPRQRSLEPISEFRNACEIDGNVGSGREEADRIIAILDKLRDMEIEIKDKPVALLTFIDKLTKANKINSRRPDQGEATSVLSEKGFVPAFANHTIIKVATQDRKLNFVQTFLTFRSSLFRSIPYNDTVVHNGKTMNTREVYSNLVLDEIEKMPSFDVRTTAEKDAFPSDADWARLSTDFNLNFTIYYDNNGVGATDLSAANRPNTGSFIVFKEKNNRYFPVRFEPAIVGAPGIPAGQPGAPVTTFNRGILGGAIDGIRFTIPNDEVARSTGNVLAEAITTSKKSTLPDTKEEADATKEQTASAFNKWVESFTFVSDDTEVTPEIQQKINEIIKRNGQTKKFKASRYGIDRADYKTSDTGKIRQIVDKNTLMSYYLRNNKIEFKPYETLFGISNKTIKYVLEVCGAIMEVKIDDNVPTFILHTNNSPGFIVYDNCHYVGLMTNPPRPFWWMIYSIDLINLTCIGKTLGSTTLLLNVFDYPLVRKDKLHPFTFKRLQEPAKTYDIGSSPIYSFSSIPAEYDDVMIVMPDVMMFLFRRSFSSPSSFTPTDVGCKKLETGHMANFSGWNTKAEKAVFRGSFTTCDVPIESNIRFRAHLLSLAFPDHLDAVVSNGYEGLVYGDHSIKVEGIRDWGNRNKRLSPNQQQNGYKYVLELEGFASAWRIVQEMFYSSLLLVPDSKFSDVLRSIIKPWVHYVPVKEDLSDLISKIEWCNDNTEDVRFMITQMNCLAHDTVTFNNVIRFSGEVFSGKQSSMKPAINTGSEKSYEPDGVVFSNNVVPAPNSEGTITETPYNPDVPTPPVVRKIQFYDARIVPPGSASGLVPPPGSASGLVPPPGSASGTAPLLGTSGLPGSGFGSPPGSASGTGLGAALAEPIVPETPEFKAELDALMMKSTQDKALVDAIVNAATGVDDITKQYVRGLLESALRQKEYNTVKLLENWNTYQKSGKQSIIRKIDSISNATRLFQNLERPAPEPAPAPAASIVAAQAQLEAANRKPLGPGDSAANQLDSGPQRLGGRHKTTTNWRRSKPSRYTRRKF